MLIVYEDIGMHCCLHHHYYHCCWGLVVNQQNHVLDCCVCCFLMFGMAIMVDRRCLCGFLVNLWRFMVVFGTVLVILYETGCTSLCFGGKWPISMLAWWLSEVFESHWCQWCHRLLELAGKTLVWVSGVFCSCLGLGSKLSLFGFWAQHFKNQNPTSNPTLGLDPTWLETP